MMGQVVLRPVQEGTMPPTLSRARLWLLLPLLSGCTAVPARFESHAPPQAAQGFVLVANGAGGFQTAPRAIAAAVDQCRLPLHVCSFDWTHGRGRALADLLDVDHSRCEGRRLAVEVCQLRAARPDIPVFLVGYSAGAAVVLAAAEYLPPDSVERIVLLAPAVSSCYDLRRALLSARCGLDAFISDRDRFYLGLGTAVTGTADGRRDPPAGRVGFHLPVLFPGEEALAARLHQHPWDPCVRWTGNEGEHSGALRPAYLRVFVLPLLTPR
jgi:pimeloyl-ACP methyl ester carboxylesterase